jgi:hypothetical protein
MTEPVSIDMKRFFTQYKEAYNSTLPPGPPALPNAKGPLLLPYTEEEIAHFVKETSVQLPNDVRHYLLNVSRELVTGQFPTGAVLPESFVVESFDENPETESGAGCLRIGTHARLSKGDIWHGLVVDPDSKEYGSVWIVVTGENRKIRAWKDFTTYITTFIMKIMEQMGGNPGGNPGSP